MRLSVTRSCPTPPPLLTSQYETLRRAALGEALPPEARSGLTLFLYRGMWGWARTLPAASTPPHPQPTTSLCPMEPCERNTVIQLFAALAMHPHERRAP
jgi:hypothetical protein